MELIDQPVILADGSTLNCLGIVLNVQFAPTNTYCETVDLLVFPLRSYDILVGMAWLRAHHTHIDCHALSLKFWPFNCLLFTDANMHVINCNGTAHPNLASVTIPASLHMLTCNQFKKFLKEEPDVETCAVFWWADKPDALPLFHIEANLADVKACSNLDFTLNTLRARTDLPPEIRDGFAKVLESFSTTVFEDRKYSSLEDALARNVEHEINEIPHQLHPCRPVYHLSPPMLDELRCQLKALSEAGLVRPSMSPYGAPVVLFTRKKDGLWRMCIDY
jgi:hypothetical protein